MFAQHGTAETLLRRFLHLAGDANVASEFMMMGAIGIERGSTVHLYKHIDTRRLLVLDASGHAYCGRALLLPSPRHALWEVLGEIVLPC